MSSLVTRPSLHVQNNNLFFVFFLRVRGRPGYEAKTCQLSISSRLSSATYTGIGSLTSGTFERGAATHVTKSAHKVL